MDPGIFLGWIVRTCGSWADVFKFSIDWIEVVGPKGQSVHSQYGVDPVPGKCISFLTVAMRPYSE